MVDSEAIKEKVFRRWCNSILLSIHTCMEDLSLDVQDGVKLCMLVQLLSKKSVPHFNNPDQQERKQNIDALLAFLKNSGCTDDQTVICDAIVKGNTKAVCSLIWSIITCYQIKPLLPTQAMSIYEAVKHLVNSRLPLDHQVHNFTSDWKNGVALTKLAKDSLPSMWNPDELNILDAAEKYLEVPRILFYEELQSPDIDEESIVTYVTLFLTKLAQLPSTRRQADLTGMAQATLSNNLSFTVHTSLPVTNGTLESLVTQDPPYSPQGINVEISVVTHSDEVAVGCLTDASSSITSHVKVVVMYNGSSTAQLVSTIISKILEDIAEYFNTSIYFEQIMQYDGTPSTPTYGWTAPSGSLI